MIFLVWLKPTSTGGCSQKKRNFIFILKDGGTAYTSDAAKILPQIILLLINMEVQQYSASTNQYNILLAKPWTSVCWEGGHGPGAEVVPIIHYESSLHTNLIHPKKVSLQFMPNTDPSLTSALILDAPSSIPTRSLLSNRRIQEGRGSYHSPNSWK